MNRLILLSSVMACLLLPTSVRAQSLSIPLTPPNWTVSVAQKTVIGGVTYNVTGTLTVAPAPTSGELPNGTLGPMIGRLNPTLGMLLIQGNGFGPQGGGVEADFSPLPVMSWSDAAIQVDVSNAIGRKHLLMVQTAAGSYYMTSFPSP